MMEPKKPGPANGTKAKAKLDKISAKHGREHKNQVKEGMAPRDRTWAEARDLERRRKAAREARRQRVYNARRNRK